MVTGASGNVGTSVLAALADDPEVEGVLGLARRRPAAAFPKTEWAQADVARDDLARVFDGADAVIHLAWQIQPSHDLERLRATNVVGSSRVFDAAAAAGVGSIVYASSVGAYSPGPKDRAVDEDWPTEGVPTSFYARHKAEVERALDRFERENPEIRVARLRPGLIFKRDAATGIRRLFAGPLLPSPLLRPSLIPFVPDPGGRLVFQAVHSLDVGEAYRLALHSGAGGAFNIAAEPVLDSASLARLFGARVLRVPPRLLVGAAALSWRLRLQPSPRGWVDMALAVPLMDTARARQVLGWQPRRGSEEALLELLEGMRDGEGLPTPPLDPAASGRMRVRELFTGVGGRGY